MRNALCEICKQIKSVEDMKYVMRGSKTLFSCSKCSGTVTKSTPALKKSFDKPISSEEKELRKCMRCNYKYRQNPKLKVVCPNCGRGDKTIKL